MGTYRHNITANFGQFLIDEDYHKGGDTVPYCGKNFKYFKIIGCNQAVHNFNYDFHVLVAKQTAHQTLRDANTTIEKFIEESKRFGLNFELCEDVFLGGIEYNVFKIIYDKQSPKRAYYSFCYVRHLYYDQVAIIRYFSNLQESDIRAHYCLFSSQHTILPCIGYVLNKDLSRMFKSGMNNTSIYSCNLAQFLQGVIPNYCYIEINPKYLDIMEMFHNVINNNHILVLSNKDEGVEISIANKKICCKNIERKEDHVYFPKHPTGIFGLTVFEEMKNNQKIRILSRHPSHDPLRALKFPKKILYRLGSTTNVNTDKFDIEINTVESINNSSNKAIMKELFIKNKVDTPRLYSLEELNTMIETKEKFPKVVAKHIYGSRGTGNYLLNNKTEFSKFVKTKENIKDFIFEQFCSYSYEYRIHVSKKGIFLIWQKLRRKDTPDDRRWVYNNDNCVFISQTNQLFIPISDKDRLNLVCVSAIKAVGLTIGAVDLKMDKKGNFKIIEVNSAPSLGDVGLEFYEKELLKLCAE